MDIYDRIDNMLYAMDALRQEIFELQKHGEQLKHIAKADKISAADLDKFLKAARSGLKSSMDTVTDALETLKIEEDK